MLWLMAVKGDLIPRRKKRKVRRKRRRK